MNYRLCILAPTLALAVFLPEIRAEGTAAGDVESRGGCGCFADLPQQADPRAVGRRIAEQFLRTRPESYCPPGYRGNGYNDTGYGRGKAVQYSVVSLWVHALSFARRTGDAALEARLVRLYDDFLPGGKLNGVCSQPYHVDDAIFGAVPLEIYLHNRDGRYLAAGLRYADTQWSSPCEGTLRTRHALSRAEQEDFFSRGYTPQTRLWIDDMYMITALQSQAYCATGKREYIERAAYEMCLYLDRLQLKDGPAKGLFYHAPDVPFVWGRGDGWMAAGMTLVLRHLPADSVHRARILAGYREMMAALLRYQRADGMWSQLVDEPDNPANWPESSCTGMFAYAFVTGVCRGWLEAATYAAPARRAWIALCASLDEFGNVPQTCCGTGKRNDRRYYFDRTRVHGDPHGQAPMLWCANALLEEPRLLPVAEEVTERAPWGAVTVTVPSFPNRAFSIADCAGDANRAMAACAAAGGGRVVVPKGMWLSKGPVRFRSNCLLCLEDGAELRFSDDPKDYLPAVHTTWEGSECMNYSPLVYAYGCTNVGIVGKGKLHPVKKGWNAWNGRPPAHQRMTANLYHWMSTNAPAVSRDVTRDSGNFRPHLIQFNRSRNIVLRDFKIVDSPFWTEHLYLCRNVLVEGVDSYAHGHNNDGIDIEMTQDVIIRNCRFDQGDDGVVLKSGRNQDAWRLNTPTRNVVVRDCELVSGHGLLVVGSEMAGGVENVYMRDCRATGGEVLRLFYLKTNERRGGFLRHITMERCTARKVRFGAFEIATDVLYQWAKLPTYEVRPTEIDDINMFDCAVESAERRYHIAGDSRKPIGSVRLRNVKVGRTFRDSISGNIADLIDEDRLGAGQAREFDILTQQERK